MKKKIVFIPVAHKKGYSMSANLSCDNDKGYEIYLQNAIVALKSVKDYNTDVDVAIVTNIPLTNYYQELTKKHGILHYECPFVDFVMPANFTWSLTFFKIATIKYVVEHLNYEYYLQLESDEICINSLSDMWEELDNKLLTVFSPFRYNHSNRECYSKLYNRYCNNSNKTIIEKTGAGFVAANRDNMLHFIQSCEEIYEYIQAHVDELDSSLGDELYTSLYCAIYPEKVARANPYVDIYWTEKFYFTSTNYFYDAVSVLHLPSEKGRGMLALYRYLIKYGKLPNVKKIYKIMSLPKLKPPLYWENTYIKYMNAIRNRVFKNR